MRLLTAAILTLACIGCSSTTCADGSGSFLFWERGNYKSCGMECSHEPAKVGALNGARVGENIGNGSTHAAEKCGCSAQCPCWRKH